MNLGLHIIKNPKGTYHFVGNVPIELAFIYDDKQDALDAVKFGPGLIRQIAEKAGRKFATRTFVTEADALAALETYKAS